MAWPLEQWTRKTVLFLNLVFQPLSQFQGRKETVKTMSTIALRRGEARGNASNDYREADRILYMQCQMHSMDYCVGLSTYGCLLQDCVKKKSLSEGRQVHMRIIASGLQPGVTLGNMLVNMYAKCGSVLDAGKVLDEMPERNVASWTTMIAGCVQNGYVDEALTLFHEMKQMGVQPNQFTFVSILPACASMAFSINHGKEIHEEIIRSGFQSNIFVGNTLMGMYAKYGIMENARAVFDRMPLRSVVSWNTMITGYAQNGFLDEAVEVFEKMPERNVVSWTAMIAGYTQNGYYKEALKLFQQMLRAGVKPNSQTFVAIVTVCRSLEFMEQGKEIHEEINRRGYQSDLFVGSALVDMYAKCHCIENAREVFENMHQRDVVLWNAMIEGYAQNGNLVEAMKLFREMPERDVLSWNAIIAGHVHNARCKEALKLFRKMQLEGMVSNAQTFSSILSACGNLVALEYGKEVHGVIIKSIFKYDISVCSTLVGMYAKCGNIEDAQNVFDKMPQQDTISWNVMISGYAQNGLVDNAQKLFQEMPERVVVSWNTMIAAYGQNGHVREAVELFRKMPERDVVSWNSMIIGFAQNGHGQEALNMFQQMQLACVKPNSETFAITLPACANLTALEQGKEVHGVIIRSGCQFNVYVGSALVDMYSKCGSIENARNVFDSMPQRDVISWNAMIMGYAMHGCSKEALQLFDQMEHLDANPDHVTFLGVLSACCHSGFVGEAREYFTDMSFYHQITPTMDHYGCMVDLLGRAGRLQEAQDFVNKMPIKPDAAVWVSLLGACRVHHNVELGESVAECLYDLDPRNAATYVLLSNIYAAAGRWDGIERVRKLMKDRKVKNTPGCSWIEVHKQVHVFILGDGSYSHTEDLCTAGEVIWTDEC